MRLSPGDNASRSDQPWFLRQMGPMPSVTLVGSVSFVSQMRHGQLRRRSVSGRISAGVGVVVVVIVASG